MLIRFFYFNLIFRYKLIILIYFFFAHDEIKLTYLLTYLPCYLQDTMPCQRSSSNFLPRLLRIWESVFYSQAFFTLHSFVLVLKRTWDRQFNLNISRASCWYFRNIAPVRLFVWITTIHDKIYRGNFYLSVL